MTLEEIQAVQDRHNDELMAVDGVIGVYIGALEDSSLCIKVIILDETPEIRRRIPKTLEGVPVVLEESDPIRPLDDAGR